MRRERYGYVLDTGEGLLFTMSEQQGKRLRLTAIDDRNGNRILLRYQDGVLVEVTDSVGRIVKISPTPDGRIGAISVRNAEVRGQWVRFARYDYDDRGQLIEATDADGFSNRYRYDDRDRHFLVENHYKTGLVFNFRYDRKQRCVESYGAYPGRRDPSLAPGLPTQLADGQTPLRGVHHVVVEYLPDGFRHVYDSTRTESYGVNEHGLLDMANIGGSLTTSTFRDDGWQMSETDALGGTTRYERDVRGKITSVEDALGRVTTYERDPQGLVTKIVDPAGGVTELSRDPRGNVMVIKDAAGGVTSYQRDAQGKVTAIVDARGATTHLSYDAQANLVAVVLPNGGCWQYGYDGLGRLMSRTDPLGATTHYAYSNRGDLVSERDALGNVTRYSYDGDGYLTQLVNPVGAVTKLGWGGLHKLCERVDANGHRVALRYNHEGELLQVENEEGELHHLDRDLNGLLIGERTFDDRHLRYRNDLLGRTVRVENGAGEVTELEYDPASQLLRRMLHDGTAEAFSYDARGELVTATNAAGEFTFDRDPLGRIVREVQKVGDEAHWVEVRYDPEGDRIGRTTSLGHQETVRRDALGARLETVLDGEVIGHTNDALGREVARLLPGGGRIETAFDPLGRVARRRALDRSASAMVPAGQPDWTGPIARGVTVDTRYRYAPDGELVETLDQARGTTEYRYDPIGQLLAMVPQQAKAEIFRYDPRGNIHEAAPGDPARVYGKGNRLLRKGATEYRWDGDGRLIEKRTAKEDGDEIWRYRWNAAGLLAEVERPDRQRVRFTYDPFARRMAKEHLVRKTGVTLAPPVHIRYVWDAHLIVHELRNTPSGSTSDQGESTYLFADGSYEPTTMVRGGAKSYFLNDQVGCPRVIIDSHGERLEVVGRTAWGTARLGEGEPQTINPFGLQGQYADEETGLHYNRHRFYDSATGVFVSRDPIGLAGGSMRIRLRATRWHGLIHLV